MLLHSAQVRREVIAEDDEKSVLRTRPQLYKDVGGVVIADPGFD